MRVLVVSNSWPDDEWPSRGLFVKEQVESLAEVGVEVDVLHFDGRRSKLNYLKLLPKLKRRMNQFKPDIVHAHYGLTGAMCALLPRIPLIVTYHGSDVFTPKQRVFSRFASMRARANICVSEVLSAALGRKGTQIIPCGVDVRLFRPLDQLEAKKKLDLPLNKRIVLFPGDRTNLVKDFDLFEKSIRRIQGLDLHVCELIGIDREDVPYLMNAADVLVLTSKHEGYCLAVTEALACGLPVVAVPVGNVKARIENVRHCQIVPRDSAQIAEATQLILESQKRVDPLPDLTGLTRLDVAKSILALYKRLKSL